jgi:hypothetical protein
MSSPQINILENPLPSDPPSQQIPSTPSAVINQSPWFQFSAGYNKLPVPESLPIKLCKTGPNSYDSINCSTNNRNIGNLYCQMFGMQSLNPKQNYFDKVLTCNTSGQLTDPYEVVFQKNNVFQSNTFFMLDPR